MRVNPVYMAQLNTSKEYRPEQTKPKESKGESFKDILEAEMKHECGNCKWAEHFVDGGILLLPDETETEFVALIQCMQLFEITGKQVLMKMTEQCDCYEEE